MSSLHTVNKSPFQANSLDACLEYAKEGGSVLLIEDGVFAALKNTAASDKVIKGMQRLKFYVLGADVRARGFGESNIIDGIKVVDYGGFVDLVTEHDKVQPWL